MTIHAAVLDRHFYARDTLIVARDLLGKKLVRQIDHQKLSGIIVETEAYCGRADSACHAHRGMTKRNAVMFGEPGHAYVYFTYGMHHLLNLVTESTGTPCAVLIRAIMPVSGLEAMEARRLKRGKNLTNGPGKVCQALGIDLAQNGLDVTTGNSLWVEETLEPTTRAIETTPRIGIDYANPEDLNALWRFLLRPL
ncbi:MAG: DNA-3-methyladenine glycosylase [Smithellaceae bacterium]